MNTAIENTTVNGIDIEGLKTAAEAIAQNPAEGMTHWKVSSQWRGGTRSDSRVSGYEIGGKRVARDFTLRTDEPTELFGQNLHPNPQEYLLAGLNACMIVGYTLLCAEQKIELQELRIETEGEIDLRGVLGLAPDVKAGYDHLRYTVHIKGNGTPEQFEEIHRKVMATSPNYYNIRNAIPLQSRLVVR